MKQFFAAASVCVALALSVLIAAALTAAPQATRQTWAGKISDSKCGASHAAMEQRAQIASDHECTEACIKGGAKYVFVTADKVYEISNQSLPALSTYSGQDVTLTGEVAGNGITVAKVEPRKASPKK